MLARNTWTIAAVVSTACAPAKASAPERQSSEVVVRWRFCHSTTAAEPHHVMPTVYAVFEGALGEPGSEQRTVTIPLGEIPECFFVKERAVLWCAHPWYETRYELELRRQQQGSLEVWLHAFKENWQDGPAEAREQTPRSAMKGRVRIRTDAVVVQKIEDDCWE